MCGRGFSEDQKRFLKVPAKKSVVVLRLRCAGFLKLAFALNPKPSIQSVCEM